MNENLDILMDSNGGITLAITNRILLADSRPALAWRHAGAAAWRWADVTGVQAPQAEPARLAASFRLGPMRVQLQIHRFFENAWEFAGTLHNETDQALELARLHYLQGVLAGEWNLLALTENQLFRRGESIAPHKERLERMWAACNVFWPRLDDPIHGEADWGVATDCAVLMHGWNDPGLVCGFTGPGRAFGEIGLRSVGQPMFYLGTPLDNILLDPGQSRPLERAILTWGDWQDGLRLWAGQCAKELGTRPIRPPLVGWCSWYQQGHQVRQEHVRRAMREFAAWPIPPGGRTLQIDDGFQIMPGDWRPNARFSEGWANLPGEIAATGSIPGLWLAPTTIFHRHPIVHAHPDWLQRMPDGQPAVHFSNWGWCERDDYRWGDVQSPTYYLDPDHPGAQAFMADIVRDAVRAGWRYLKLDFTYALSRARRAWDRSRTSMESLRGLYQLLREAAGPDTILCACIGEMGRYALGYADTARLGGDIPATWPGVKHNLPEFALRTCTNGLWWNGDPDVFYMRAEGSQLTPEESWVLTGSIGLIGGVFLTSDFPTQWDSEAARRVAHFWNEQGPHLPGVQRGLFAPDGALLALRVTAADGSMHRIGLYNWADTPQTVRVPLHTLQLPPTVTLAGTFPAAPPLRMEGGCLVGENVPPHSLRLGIFGMVQKPSIGATLVGPPLAACRPRPGRRRPSTTPFAQTLRRVKSEGPT